jgi:hypothetical protein
MSFASNVVDFRCLANEQPNVVICLNEKVKKEEEEEEAKLYECKI